MAVLGQVATEAFPQLTITQSQTWVPPQDGTVCIHVVGAGGGGTGSNNHRGGGAGAYAKIPSLAVTTSGSYTLVVGVGGGGTVNTNPTNAVAGGNSTIAGTGLTGTKTAGGGDGATNAPANGAGGQVSGSGEGWAGYTGGAGADSGGGAVGVFATGNNGSIRLTDAVAGGLAMSGFGIICGGSQIARAGSVYMHQTQINQPPQAGDLCGGSGLDAGSANIYSMIMGGGGGIGGGGGGGKNRGSVADSIGAPGGDGIILIQYLPW